MNLVPPGISLLQQAKFAHFLEKNNTAGAQQLVDHPESPEDADGNRYLNVADRKSEIQLLSLIILPAIEFYCIITSCTFILYF